MKKSLLALAALSTLAASAHAQSSVTIYGRIDQSIAQQADAVDNKEVRPGSGNRLGFRGVEDLGGGLKGVFLLEHRFNADDGTLNNANVFWQGRSWVGLDTPYGRVTLGREENAAYQLVHGRADPWNSDTVAATTSITQGRIGAQRYANALNYNGTFGGFTVAAQVAERDGNTPSFSRPTQVPGAPAIPAGAITAADRPYSVAVDYKAGPIQAAIGYENPADADDHWLAGYLAYSVGVFRVSGFYGTGKNALDQKHQAYLLTGTARVGSGEFRIGYGQLKNKDVVAGVYDKQFAVGYHHALSKRTTLYTDIVNEKRDRMAANLKSTGWDLGIKHNF